MADRKNTTIPITEFYKIVLDQSTSCNCQQEVMPQLFHSVGVLTAPRGQVRHLQSKPGIAAQSQ